MSGGTNRPLVYNGEPYQFEVKTLLQLRNKLMIRLGFAAQLSAPPPGTVILLNDFLQDAQEEMYNRFSPLRNQMWWRIPVTAGNRHYDIPSISTGEITATFADNDPSVDTITRLDGGNFINEGFTPGMVISVSGAGLNANMSFVVAAVTATVITITTAGNVVASAAETVTINTITYKALDMRRISEQWVSEEGRDWWWQMIDGIPTGRFNETGQAYPQNYEWSDHLEIWPAPEKNYTIYVKGHFGLLPFEADTDVTTIDHKLVSLHAIAFAKQHYGQQDSGSYFRSLEIFLKGLNRKTFGQKRYIPNPDREAKVLSKPEGTWR